MLSLPESSWGAGGGHFTWLNDDTEWMWPLIHAAERRMEDLVTRFPDSEGTRREVLNQAARELLLLQSSDWPFLVTTLQAKDVRRRTVPGAPGRFDQLASLAQSSAYSAADESYLAELRERDNPFATIDYRDWTPRQGYAGAPPAVSAA